MADAFCQPLYIDHSPLTIHDLPAQKYRIGPDYVPGL
jgi:hypothetical protein